MQTIPLHAVNIGCCDWFSKETDWPIAGQDMVRLVNQIKDTGKKKGRVRGVASQT